MDHPNPLSCDWTAPWFEPWRAQGERVALRRNAGHTLHDALNAEDASPVRFVAHEELPTGTPYEQFVLDTGRCPTRGNLHDFFNGLAWLALPLAKRQLNHIHAREIAAGGVRAKRGPVRDAATLFDESGAVMFAPKPLWQALRQRDWQQLFIGVRPLWRDARLLVFGHALLEKLVRPRKNLTAHLLDVSAPAASGPQLDEWLAAQLTAERLAGKPFMPLPLLGIPGWCSENQQVCFYDDAHVFRPRRA